MSLIERLPGQQGHDEEGLLVAVFFVLPHVEDLDDVGMADGLEGRALFVEQLERERIGELVEGLDRDFTVHGRGVVGAEDHAHAPFAQL